MQSEQLKNIPSTINNHPRSGFVAIVVVILSIVSTPSISQVIQAGFKVGAHANWVKIDDPGARDTLSTGVNAGFSLGPAVSFKVRDRYFLYTEYLYTRKGKTITSKVDPTLKDKLTYNYFEVPVLFAMHFKGNLGENKKFKWYVGAGPDVSYLIGGKGVVEGGDLLDNEMILHYKIRFDSREDRDRPDEIHYDNANRVQFGLNVGSGILLEPGGGKHKVMIDVRYSLDQSRLGKGKADYLVPTDYDDDLRARYRALKFSVIYMFESNTSKQERNKGKSTLPKHR